MIEPLTAAWQVGLATGLLVLAAGQGRAVGAETPPPSTEPPAPPRAAVEPEVREIHGRQHTDPYAWLEERAAPRVIAHLEAENAYTEAVMAPTRPLQERLYEEIRGRIQETDSSVPALYRGAWYYTRTEEGREYPIHCRRVRDRRAPEQVVLDENGLAAGHDYFDLGVFEISPSGRLLAYSVDTDGHEDYQLRFRDLETGRDLEDVIPSTSWSVAWAADSRTVFYTTRDAAWRPHRVWRHRLGSPASDDVLVFEEPDERFFVDVRTTGSERFLVIRLQSAVTSEEWILPADRPEGEFRVVWPRRHEIEYVLHHRGEHFFIRTSDGAKDFRLVRVPVDDPSPAAAAEVIPHRPGIKLSWVKVFEGFLVVAERLDGVERLRVLGPEEGSERIVPLPEPVYAIDPGDNPEFDTGHFRFEYSSPVTPETVYDYEVAADRLVMRKRQPVPGGYDPRGYRVERLWAEAPDGVRVPMTVAYPVDLERDGSHPALLYGYGSYGASIDPGFRSDRLSLLERGFVYAIAHVRGGGELGEKWHDAGKLERKQNTFRDFIACAETLVAAGFTRPERLAIVGRSAGGLLIGAVLNARPDLFGAAIAGVPFVDVVNTMLDDSIPLTVTEYEEWGNPNRREDYETMMSYSPYDNVAAREYPHLLVTAGLNDPRVQYWEPAKWVARLRATRSGGGRLLLKTNMEVGHGGASGRYEEMKEKAFEYAFLLDVLGVEEDTDAR